MDRRDFLKTGVLGAATTLATKPAAAQPPAGSAADRMRIAFIGMGARAHQLCDAALALPNVEVVSLCDAYTGRAERGRARAGGKALIVDDYRRILDDRGVNAVVIATPDHWHRQMTLDALSAGKDVYLEKPMTFRLEEGPEIIAAVEKHGRVLQVGSQGVSSAQQIKAREIVKSGVLGQITMVRAAFHRNSAGGAWLYPVPPDANDRTVNWAQFLGPAPKRPFDLERFFRWRCYWDYSGGLATDLFVHLTSWIHYVLDVRKPSSVLASGQTYRWKTHEVPDTLIAVLTYPEGFTVTLSCTLNSEAGSQSGVEILGTKAALRLQDSSLALDTESGGEDNRWVVRSWPQALEQAHYADPKVQAVESPYTWRQKSVAASERWTVGGEDDTIAHFRNFFDAVRTRKQPVEDARFGHDAAAPAHLINQAVRKT